MNISTPSHLLQYQLWDTQVNKFRVGPSWQSGCFRHQGSAERVESLANFDMKHLFTINCIEKTKIKKKRPGMAHFVTISDHSNYSALK